MSILPKVDLSVDAARSCNHWLCCFGCSCCTPKSPRVVAISPPISETDLDVTIVHTVDKVEIVRHRHINHLPPK